MAQLNYLIRAHVRDDKREIQGKTLTRPELFAADGVNMVYVVDVDIGRTGRDPITGEKTVRPLRNVPVASGNHQLRYADVGSAVTLSRTKNGRWQVMGFSKEMPDKYFRVAVTLPDLCLGTGAAVSEGENIGLLSRVLTLGELATIGGGFGRGRLQAVAIFQGTQLLELR